MITVLGDRVLVALPPHDEELITDAGLVLVKDPDRFYTPTRGIVMQVGTKRDTTTLEDMRGMIDDLAFDAKCIGGYDVDREEPRRVCDYQELVGNLSLREPAPFDVQVGDCVVFGLSAGDKISLDGIDYVVLHESDIIGIVEPVKDTAA